MDFYELIGFYIGDGNIYYNKKQNFWRFELVGNVDEDYDYFAQIKEFLTKYSNKKPQLFVREEKNGRSLRLMLYDKQFIDKLLDLGFSVGGKTFSIAIPDLVEKEQRISVIRGLFEADGCLYFSKSKKNKYPTYPRLEIKTSSKLLSVQLEEFLKGLGFNTYKRTSKNSSIWAIGVSGEFALEKWRKLFGFVSLKNKTKYGFWKTKGFYIPRTPLNKRMKYAHVAQW